MKIKLNLKLKVKKLPPLKPAKVTLPSLKGSTKKTSLNSKKSVKIKLPLRIKLGSIKVVPKMSWYVIAVNMNCSDSSCRKQIHELKRRDEFKKLIGKICIPKEKYYGETKDGDVVERERAKFKGYVILQCVMTKEVREELKGLKSVYTVLMRPGNEVALSSEDEANLYVVSEGSTKRKKKIVTAEDIGIEDNVEEPAPTLNDMYPPFLEQIKKDKVANSETCRLYHNNHNIEEVSKNKFDPTKDIPFTAPDKIPTPPIPAKPPIRLNYKVGERVGITDPSSSFYDYIGPITAILPNNKAKVSIDMLGRPCEVTVPFEFLQLV